MNIKDKIVFLTSDIIVARRIHSITLSNAQIHANSTSVFCVHLAHMQSHTYLCCHNALSLSDERAFGAHAVTLSPVLP